MVVAIEIDLATRYQRIDGFGCCVAFQRADVMRGARELPPESQRQVLDLLFSRECGAGLSIVRLGIGSSADRTWDRMRSIAPCDPGGPHLPLRYEWDGDDSGQLWLAREAMRYGVRRYFACAWSAPGYMMSNGSDTGGGVLCGLPGTPRDRGDWRAAYAEYLLQYVRFYRSEGIAITDLGFCNEPDLFLIKEEHEVSYAAMRMNPAQVVDFVKVVGPAIERSGLPVSLAACDAVSWSRQADFSAAIEADPEAARWVQVHTGHSYIERARSPLPTARTTWMSEWEPDVEGNTWVTAWDGGVRADGFGLAEDIHDTLTTANVNGYLYWLGASVGGTRALIQLDGSRYNVSKRLWALAAFSRFVRPDAVRVAAITAEPGLKVSAFANTDGRTVLNILNTGTVPVTVALPRAGLGGSGVPAVYVTDWARSLAPRAVLDWVGAATVLRLDPRSLTTVVGQPADGG